MRKRLLIGIGALFALSSGPSFAEDAGFAVTATLTSNYVSRGITNSNNRPAVQGSVEYHIPAGLYVGAWASTIDFKDSPYNSPAELDYDAGYRFGLGGFSVDVGAVHYAYPSSNPNNRYNEYYAKVTRGISKALTVNAQVYYSPEFFGKNGTSTYAQVGMVGQLADWLTTDLNVGEQWVKNIDATAGAGYPYTNWNAGLTATYKTLSFDGRLSGSGLSKAECLIAAGNVSWCGAALVGSVTLHFP